MKKLSVITIFLGVCLNLLGQTYSTDLFNAAQTGNVEAQFELALCYHYGYGIAQDRAKALYWTQQAANNGSVAAQYNVGWYYENGEGTEANSYTAFKWYKKAADAGDPSGEYALARCYENGIGVPKDSVESVKWYKKAAIDGDSDAQVHMGFAYLFGLGINSDSFLSTYWFRKAAEQNNSAGLYWLGECYENGVGVEKDESEALSYYRKSADLGFDLAQVAMAKDALRNDKYEIGLNWLRKAVNQDNSDAEILLGLCYENGWGVSQSLWEAKKYYENAGTHGNSMGYFHIGRLYADENSSIYNLPSAFDWYMKAAKDDNAQAQGIVAYMYLAGNGVAENLSEGLRWLNIACENEDSWSLAVGGMLYYDGLENISKDYNKAFRYLSKAFEAEEIDEGMRSNVIEYLANCYQYGRGTTRNSNKATELRNLIHSTSSTSVNRSQNRSSQRPQPKAKKVGTKKTLPSWEEKMKQK